MDQNPTKFISSEHLAKPETIGNALEQRFPTFLCSRTPQQLIKNWRTNEQQCPTVYLRSPQLWRINKAIRHIFMTEKIASPISNILKFFDKFLHPGPSLFIVSCCF